MERYIIYGILALVLIVLYKVISSRKETFVSEFLDKGNEMKTSKTKQSSYAQETNHFKLTSSGLSAPDGNESPFRVNIWNSYIP